MGLSHSSAPLSGHGRLCAAGRGTVEPAAGTRTLSPAQRLLLTGIRFYQAVFSALMPMSCKFYPTCSHYAVEAISRHGAGRGLRLAAWRLVRCSPFARGGVDLVPDLPEAADARDVIPDTTSEARP